MSDQPDNSGVYLTDSVWEDDRKHAVYGRATRGIVDDAQGGVIAYVHADNADALRDAWAAYTSARIS